MKNVKHENRALKRANWLKRYALAALIGLLAFPLFIEKEMPIPAANNTEIIIEANTTETDVTDDDLFIW